nr:PEP/pyruvate-binding domain-containing protein [Thermus scotoductus]
MIRGWHLKDLDPDNLLALQRASRRLRNLILKGEYPEDLEEEIRQAYRTLSQEAGEEALPVAVRSSATAEDLPTASFAGQQESYLYVQGEEELLLHVKRAMASLFTARAISYRAHMGFDHLKVALSVGVQRMVRADTATSGVIFTLDPDTGHRGFVYITAIYGLGENIVQGRVGPDAYYVHKETLKAGYRALVHKKLGPKELTLAFDPREGRLRNRPTPPYLRNQFALSEDEALLLADWSIKIEEHYSGKRGTPTPMDIEWAKDGPTGELFILQARPETVHSQKAPVLRIHRLLERGEVLAEGLAVGEAIATGRARVLKDPREMDRFQEGEVLVTETTNPDWEPIMKRAAAIVTERGGRTSHAAIVARELGVPAVVGAGEMAELFLTHLKAQGVDRVLVVNRTVERARALAERFGGEAYGLLALPQVLRQADLVVASAASPHYLVRPEDLPRRSKPLFLIDIALPRNIDPRVGRLPQAYLYNLDDLKRVVEKNLKARQGEVPKVEVLIEGAIGDYLEWYAGHRVREAIRALKGLAYKEVVREYPEADPLTWHKEAGRRAHPWILAVKARTQEFFQGPPCPGECPLLAFRPPRL